MSTATINLKIWLENLRSLMPPQSVTVVGAGSGDSLWTKLLNEWSVPNVTLFEADHEQFERLQRSPSIQPTWQLRNEVVAQSASTATFYRTSIPSENGLLQPETLQCLWPGLVRLKAQARSTITLEALTSNATANAFGQWLIIDCQAALMQLQGTQSWLDRVDVIVVRALTRSKSDEYTPSGSQLDAIEKFLSSRSFNLHVAQPTRHPCITHALFVRDISTTLHGPSADPASARQQVVALESKLQEHVHDLERLKQQIAQLEKEKAALNLNAMAMLLHKEAADIKQQIASMLSIQHFFQTGELPFFDSDTESWAIGPDFSLLLIQLLTNKQYDLVIEFGSGYSTSLIAKVLSQQRPTRSERAIRHVAFEHLKKYWQKTTNYLAQALPTQTLDFVQVFHTPLQPYAAPDGNHYDYYACHDQLERLCVELSKNTPSCRQALIVVDGPPARTGSHARYPALPVVLDSLPGWALDFVLDDYIRDEEKEIGQMWQRYLKSVELKFSFSEIPLARGVCILSVSANEDKENHIDIQDIEM